MVRDFVSVGIMTAEHIEAQEHGDGTFTLRGVTIGKGFHWEQCRDYTYRGTLRLVREGSQETAVNTLPIEDYLSSVIASEMRSTAPVEFLKAHTVIARSWLMSQTTAKTGHTLYDVCADDHCQRYQGITAATPQMRDIVELTRGEVLTYDGNICDTRYSKCCGGVTEEYRYCWEDVDVPYLRSVPCPYCDTHDRTILAAVLNDYDLATHDFYRWRVDYTAEELSRLVNRSHKIGIVTTLEPLERGKSGRISRLRIVGSDGEVVVEKELAIRRMLSENCLYSSAFEVEQRGSMFTLRGRGWGHGVGLCQIGAAVMGSRGADYRTILTHYYPEAVITKIY